MNNWFTVEKIDCDTYVISEYKHWEETHCYLPIGMEFNTDLGIINSKEAIDKLLKK